VDGVADIGGVDGAEFGEDNRPAYESASCRR